MTHSGEHRDIVWRAEVSGRRVTVILPGGHGRTYKLPAEVADGDIEALAKKTVEDSLS